MPDLIEELMASDHEWLAELPAILPPRPREDA